MMVEPANALHVEAQDIIASFSRTTVGKAVAYCAVPHWFDINMISALRNNSEGSEMIVNDMQSLPFVIEKSEGVYTCHETIRARLIRELQRHQYALDFQTWNKRAISYFCWRMGEEAKWRDMLESEGLVLDPVPLPPFVGEVSESDKRELGLEIAYHLIALDDAKWMFVMRRLFEAAEWRKDTNICNAIYQMCKEYEFKFTPFNRVVVRYFGSVVDYLSDLPDRAASTLIGLQEELDELPDFDGKPQLATDVRDALSKIEYRKEHKD